MITTEQTIEMVLKNVRNMEDTPGFSEAYQLYDGPRDVAFAVAYHKASQHIGNAGMKQLERQIDDATQGFSLNANAFASAALASLMSLLARDVLTDEEIHVLHNAYLSIMSI